MAKKSKGNAKGKEKKATPEAADGKLEEKAYKKQLLRLQIELVKLQRFVIKHNQKILLVIEGRDAGGKDGLINRFTEHLSPRETRMVALSKPSEREMTAWYFQRFVPHLPYADEIVFFNRSWYNRAGVEPVMGFCTAQERESFLNQVIAFETALVTSGIHLFKFYLDINKAEQKKRLDERRKDPLKQWKISPVDEAAIKLWDAYTAARDSMFLRSSHPLGPWYIVKADQKKPARLNAIRQVLSQLEYDEKDFGLAAPDSKVVFRFAPEHVEDGTLAR